MIVGAIGPQSSPDANILEMAFSVSASMMKLQIRSQFRQTNVYFLNDLFSVQP